MKCNCKASLIAVGCGGFQIYPNVPTMPRHVSALCQLKPRLSAHSGYRTLRSVIYVILVKQSLLHLTFNWEYFLSLCTNGFRTCFFKSLKKILFIETTCGITEDFSFIPKPFPPQIRTCDYSLIEHRL
jgi:hypothetical protein